MKRSLSLFKITSSAVFLVCISLPLSVSSGAAQSGRAGVWNANSSSSGNAGSASDSGTGYTLHYDSRTRQYYRVPTNGGARSSYPATARSASPTRSSNSTRASYTPTARAFSPSQRAPGVQSTRPSSGRQLLDYPEKIDGRTFLVHLPQNYSQGKALPVVIVFHGLGMNGMSVRGLSAMDITAERNGFITVYPDGAGSKWNDGVQPGGGVDDVAFVSEMLDAMAKKYSLDTRRVYACGISNGGFFVQRLACELSNRIAAIGVVAASAGANVCSRCNTRRGMPAIFFLGTDDPIIPREGQSKELGKLGDALGLTDLGIKNIDSTVAKVGGIYTADEAAEFWAKNNGCAAHPRHEAIPDRDTRDGCHVSRDTFGGGVGGADVVVYTIEGGGHSWPGGMGFVARDIIGRTCNDISASDIMWQFFQSHSR